MMDAQLQNAARAACADVGIIYRDVPADGRFHETDVDGDPHGKGDGRIKLFADGEGGIAWNWKGEKRPFFADDGRTLTDAERCERDRKRQAAIKEAEAEEAKRHAEAAKKALPILKKALTATAAHPYLQTKGIQPHGTLLHIDGRLIVAMRIGKELHSLQFIAGDGAKRFLTDGRVKGCYFLIGTADEAKARGVIICEGFATGATLREVTGLAVMVAFTAGNLLEVARFVRQQIPDATIILAGDVDKTGTGQRAAAEAAQAVGGIVALPSFTAAELAADRPPSDWNDYASLRGPEAVRQGIEKAMQGTQTSAPMPAPAPTAASAPAGDPAGGSRIVVVSILDFLNKDIPPRERILAPWLLTQSMNMLYAWRGIGKTHVALGVAYASASGGSFLKWKASKPRRVLYIDGEMPAASMQDRLKAMLVANAADFDPDYFRLITPDLQTGAMPDLATAEGQDEIDAVLGDTELIVIDNLSCLARSGGRENDAESWLPIQPWALRQRQQGRSVLFVHHSGKGGAQRGTSKREDILDTVLTLKRPSNYNPADGAVFEVHFEKTRDMHGDEAAPFEARLQTDADGQSVWAYNSVEDSTFDRVVSLANEGLSQKEIAEELGINKSNVSRHIRRATDAGLIQKGGKHDRY
ncbi:MAG: AAA family ATPase [Rhodocyclaceae bacterium]